MNYPDQKSNVEWQEIDKPAVPTRCAFLSLQSGVFEGQDDAQLAELLCVFGWTVSVIDWKDQSINWDDYDVAIMRSPWDYHFHVEAFAHFLDRISASQCLLLNDSRLIRGNLNKRYLLEMGRRCDVIIPTLLFERAQHGQDRDIDQRAFKAIGQAFEQFRVSEIVVKPTVGAGSDRTYRVKASELATLSEVVGQIVKERDLLIQPYLATITTPGEFSLVFIEGEYYHCILKRPKEGDFRVQCQHGGIYERCEPDHWLINTSRDLLRSFAPTAVYARLDWVLHPEPDSPIPYLLMEMELIEPDLYLRYTSQGAAHFAKALVRAYEGRKNFEQSNAN